MQEHTKRVLARAIGFLDGYVAGTMTLRWLVDALEGSIRALEEELPAAFCDRWYRHWGSLEETLAVEGESEDRRATLPEVEALRALLLEHTAR
jgi:hypothetical protein